MALNWKTVTAEHVREACSRVAASRTGKRASRIVIEYEGQRLPAKQVQRTAYLIANHLPESAKVKFSSGDSTLNLLRGLGFKVARLEAPAESSETNCG